MVDVRSSDLADIGFFAAALSIKRLRQLHVEAVQELAVDNVALQVRLGNTGCPQAELDKLLVALRDLDSSLVRSTSPRTTTSAGRDQPSGVGSGKLIGDGPGHGGETVIRRDSVGVDQRRRHRLPHTPYP